MDKSHQVLRDFAKSGSMFFKLDDGEEAIIRFLSAEIAPNNFDGGKTTLVRYNLEVDGVKKLWDRPSRKLADQMAKIPSGALIKIKRKGQKNQTVYCVEEIKE